MYLNTNLKLLRKRRNRTQEDVALAINVKRTTINNYENGIGQASVENLLTLSDYFKISIDTLLKVDLSRLSDSQLYELEHGSDVFIRGTNLRVLATTIDANNNENIEMVPLKAKAGYTAGYNDSEFVSTLPTFQLPLLSRDRKYRAFQLDGDSMLPIPHGAYVIGEYVQDWNTIKDGNAYVVLTQDDGIVFKIAYNQLRVKRNLLLKSLNPIYQSYEISLTSVKEVWKFVNFISGEIPEPNLMKNQLLDAIHVFEKQVTDVKKNLQGLNS